MKKIVFIIITLSVLLLNQFKVSNAESPIIYLNSGTTFLIHPDTLSNRQLPNFGFGIGYPITKNVIIQEHFNIDFFSFKRGVLYTDYNLSMTKVTEGQLIGITGSSRLLTIDSNVIIYISSLKKSITPFLKLGFNYIKFNSSITYIYPNPDHIGHAQDPMIVTSTVVKSISNILAGGIGMGIDMKINENSKLFIDFNYINNLTENKKLKLIPIEAGISFKL